MAITDTRNWNELLQQRRSEFERSRLETEVQNLHGPIFGVEKMTDEQLHNLVAYHRGPTPLSA